MTQRKTAANKQAKRKQPLVSVIIPAYNNERFLRDCIESVLRQTYDKYEVIIVNDQSTDDTLYLARQYQLKYDFIKVIDNPQNMGQGYCRNHALLHTEGEYILFLDSDDFLEPVALEVAVNRIQDDKSDLVVFDWKYYKTNTRTYIYNSKDRFFSKKVLLGDDCLELLQTRNYFTVNKLYSRNFLINNNIKYGEGYIYEDIEFWVGVSAKASKISLIHSPLYNVRISSTSTTKTNHDTSRHYKGYIKAVRKSLDIVQADKRKRNYYGLYKYLIKKFWLYYEKRIPKQYRKTFMNEFVTAMRDASLVSYDIPNKLTLWTFRAGVFKYNRPKTFYVIYRLYRAKKKYKQIKRSIKLNLQQHLPNRKNDKNTQHWKELRRQPKDDIILFMGFDYRFTGNSRYLFEQILTRRKNGVFYATADTNVDDEYRVEPGSDQFYNLFYSAKIVIFESWIPENLRKTPGATWIQLWHGTPLKRMLFDSNEEEIITKRPVHKIKKYQDISRWNYFVTDNANIDRMFERAFLIPRKRILSLGYPRVKYLVDHKDDNVLKDKIKQELGISPKKKVVLYLPTWRDYNYGADADKFDFDYLMDVDRLQQVLGDEYSVIAKNHSYLDNKNANASNIDAETQELLLVADYLITDYSSVMFDAFAIDMPVVLFVKDYEKYSASRGVYKDMWRLLSGMVCDTEKKVANMIKDYDITMPSYKYVKEHLCYDKSQKYSVCDAILNIASHSGKLVRNTMVYDKLCNIGPSTLNKLAATKDNSNFTYLGIAGCTDADNLFRELKHSLQDLGDTWAVIPLKGDRPSSAELKKYDISTIITDDTDNTAYDCNVIKMPSEPTNTHHTAKPFYIRNI